MDCCFIRCYSFCFHCFRFLCFPFSYPLIFCGRQYSTAISTFSCKYIVLRTLTAAPHNDCRNLSCSRDSMCADTENRTSGKGYRGKSEGKMLRACITCKRKNCCLCPSFVPQEQVRRSNPTRKRIIIHTAEAEADFTANALEKNGPTMFDNLKRSKDAIDSVN